MIGRRKKRIAGVNRELREEFAALGLDPFELIAPNPEDLGLESLQLGDLLHWVKTYKATPSRDILEAAGMMYPPADPGYGPDEDWHMFERWIRGEPTNWSFDDLHEVNLPPPESLSDEEVETALAELASAIEKRGAVIGLNEGVPARVAYSYLLKHLREEPIPITGGKGCFVLSGCDGYCPNCFQRRWCEVGEELDWEEDRGDAGHAKKPVSRERP